MEISRINKKTFEKKRAFFDYTYKNIYMIQNPEAIIFVKYKEFICNKSILDIGVGGGRTTLFLKEFTDDYVGIDYSLPLIQYCKNKYSNLTFHHCDVRNMDIFDNEAFEFIIYSFNGLDCIINHKDRLKSLKEIYRVLKNNGLFVFSSHNKDAIKGKNGIKSPFTSNPKQLIKNLIKFPLFYFRHEKMKKYEIYEKDYSVINDSGLGYTLLTYYTSKNCQISQLNDNGFKVIDVVDMYCNSVKVDGGMSKSLCLYYVAKKEK